MTQTVEAKKRRRHEYYQAHKEEICANAHARYMKRREEMIAKSAAYGLAHRAERAAYAKAYQQTPQAKARRLEKCRAPGHKEAARLYHIEHKEHRHELHRQRYAARRAAVFDHYGHECECCGDRHPEFLTIDHINGDGAKHRKAIGQNSIYRWLVANEFPPGFRVLCMNCNWTRGLYGHCPHEEERGQC